MSGKIRPPAITASSASVCGFDLKDKSMKFRRLEELSADEALRKIEEEMK